MIIKLLLIVALLVAALFAYRAGRGGRSLAARRTGLAAAMMLAVVGITAPQLISRVANLVGVGRGTDLVLYGFVVASLFVWIGLYRRLHDMEDRFVELARQIALGRISPPEGPVIDPQEREAARPDSIAGSRTPQSTVRDTAQVGRRAQRSSVD